MLTGINSGKDARTERIPAVKYERPQIVRNRVIGQMIQETSLVICTFPDQLNCQF